MLPQTGLFCLFHVQGLPGIVPIPRFLFYPLLRQGYLLSARECADKCAHECAFADQSWVFSVFFFLSQRQGLSLN